MIDFDVLKPPDTPDYMIPAWLGCINFAMGEAAIRQSFEAESGLIWKAGPQSGLDALIDKASGHDQAIAAANEQYLLAFIQWANVHVWGPIGGGQA